MKEKETYKGIIDLSRQNTFDSNGLIDCIKQVRRMLLDLACNSKLDIYTAGDLANNLSVLDWLIDDVEYIDRGPKQ